MSPENLDIDILSLRARRVAPRQTKPPKVNRSGTIALKDVFFLKERLKKKSIL